MFLPVSYSAHMGHRYLPLPFWTPVLSFRAVTDTWSTAALLASTTLPVMSPPVACPNGTGMQLIETINRTKRRPLTSKYFRNTRVPFNKDVNWPRG
jgi:hypothetical protein